MAASTRVTGGRSAGWVAVPAGLARAVKYAAVARTQVVHGLAYPADWVGRGLTIALFLWIFFHLWRAAYGASGQTVIAGLSLHDTLWYLMLTEAMTLSRPRLSSAIGASIRSGAIAYELTRPASFLLYQASLAVGDAALRLVVNLAAGGAVVWWVAGPPPDVAVWPLVLVAVAGAWAIDCCLSTGIGLLAFATEDIAAYEWIYAKLVMTLGGLLIPLDFFPTWLRAAALHLPFAYSVYWPARVFVGQDPAAVVAVLAGQAGWFMGLVTAVWFFYGRGVRRLTINGG